jgi:serine phosphatase RsbU (regulator of sigma subunit)
VDLRRPSVDGGFALDPARPVRRLVGVAIKTSFRTKLVLALCGLSFLTAAVVLHAAWRRARESQIDNLRRLLEAVAAAVAPTIDGDAHAAFDPTQAGAATQPYEVELRRLGARVRAAHARFKEVYTLGHLEGPGPGKGRLVLAEKDDELGRVYDYARFPAMVKALGGPASDEDLTEDEYGVTLSGYAPIKDRTGRTVGLLGIDVDAETVAAMRRRLLGILALGVLGAAVFSGAIGFVLASRISRPVRVLSEAMDRVAGGDLGTRAHWISADEFGRLSQNFNRMVEGLEERQRLKQSLALAMEIQQHLLPAGPPTVPGVDVAGFSDYCDETGGDYFDYPRTWAVPGGRVALTIGDVTGHGIGAALLMSTGRAVLRSHAERDVAPGQMLGPGELLGVVNRHRAHDATSGKFMTLYYGVLDPDAGTLLYANAGQGGCFVLHAEGGRFEEMPAGAPPAGVVDGVAFPEARVEHVRAPDVIVLATDGVWETQDASGTQFGYEGLERVVRAHADGTAREIADAVRVAVEAHRGDGPQADDVTLVIAKLRPRRVTT